MKYRGSVIGVAVLLVTVRGAIGEGPSVEDQLVRPSAVRYCELPSRRRVPPSAASRFTALISAGEIEPNNTAAQATFVPLGFGAGEDVQVDATGARNGKGDVDFFSFDLEPGDVLGAELTLRGTIELRGPANELLVRSTQDDSGIYPAASPLPGDGINTSPALAWIAATPGRYTIALSNLRSGVYTLRMRLFRSPLESAAPNTRQIIFLDFNGATVNAQALFGDGNTNAVLSPLSAFLSGWGLSAANESAVITAIVDGVNDGLTDLFGANNPAFDFELRNSRDHTDPFGQPNVSRVILGGTIQQLGFSTIGIAESIDPGNFDTTETAVVLLDLLSAPDGDPNSLNSIDRAGGVGIIPLIGKAVGNVAVHELGHYSANFHTENSTGPSNDVRSVMDQGGESLPINIAGVGNNGVFGDGDDEDVDLAVDAFEQTEGFAGQEDTTNLTAFGLTSPGGPAPTPTGPTPIPTFTLTPTRTPTRTPTVPVSLCNGKPATIVGTESADTLAGTSGADVIVGLGGNDLIQGAGGNDTLCGNDGDDTLVGGTGTDFCDGGGGANSLRSCE